MPRVEEYGQPEVEQRGPSLDISARPIEEAGQMGRWVQKFGGQVMDLGDAVYHRQVQDEQENAQVTGAMNREESRANLDEQIRTGNVDVSKTMDEYGQKVDAQSDQYETPEGQKAFHRQNAINRALLFRSATGARAHIAGEKAKAVIQQSLDLDSNHLFSEPNSFPEIYHASVDAIDQQVESGAIPASVAPKLKEQYGKELAKSAVRGWAQLDPTTARSMLMGTKNNGQGAWDEFFDGDTKSQMLGYINTQEHAREIDDTRQERLEKKAKEARADAWKIKQIDRIENHTLPAAEVMKAAHDGILPWQDAKEVLGMIDRSNKASIKTDNATMKDLTMRIHLPDNDPKAITSISQLQEETQGQYIKQSDWNVLAKGIDGTPEGKGRKANKAILLKAMGTLSKTDKMFGIQDPDGDQAYASAYQYLTDLEEQYRKEKKPVELLYDANSKDSFYNKIPSFRKSPKEIMRSNRDRMRGQNDAKKATDEADKSKTAVPRGTSETPQEWLKRKRQSEGVK